MEDNTVVTAIVKSLVKEGMDPVQVLIGIHNSFVYGEILEESGYNVDDGNLEKLFNGFDVSIKAVRDMD